MMNAMEGFTGTITVGGRQIKNIIFADDIDLIVGSNVEIADLTSRLDLTSQRYGM